MKKYYCTKCEHHHVRGNIYEDHLKYKKERIDLGPEDPLDDKSPKKNERTEPNGEEVSLVLMDDKLDLAGKNQVIFEGADIKIDLCKLRNVAHRQVLRLLTKMEKTPRKEHLYRREIKKLLIHECDLSDPV